MWVTMLPGNSTEGENGGVGTVDRGMGIQRQISEGVTGNVNAIQWERLHASTEYIPKGVVLMDDDQVLAHMKTKYPT